MRIPNRLAYSILLALVLPLGLALWTYRALERSVLAHGVEHLEAVTASRMVDVNAAVQRRLTQVEEFVDNRDLRVQAFGHLAGEDEARARLVSRLDAIGATVDGARDVRVLLAGGDVVVSSTHRRDDLLPRQAFLDRAAQQASFGMPRMLDARGPTITIAAPIVQGSDFLGTLAITMNSLRLRRVLDNYRGLGETGELELVDQLADGRYYLIAPSRLGQGPAGQRIALDVNGPGARAYAGHAEATVTTDYRNERVLAITRQVDLVNWGLVVKMDIDEVMAPAVAVGRVTAGVSLLSVLFALGLVWLVRRRLTAELAGHDAALREARDALTKERFRVEREVDRVSVERAVETGENMRRMLESQKMEALGRLAGGVAHDFNNMLTVILGYCDVLMKRLRGDDAGRGHVAELRAAAERAAVLTRKLLAFGQRETVSPLVVDLSRLVEEMEPLLVRALGPEVGLTIEVSDEPSTIRADVGHIEQILLNLGLNSRDAMPGGGHVHVEVQRLPLPSGDPGVALIFRDDGIGMDDATRLRALEPFFTTKDASQAVGLGLAMVYGAVRQSGGVLTLDSELGVGTSITLHFPFVVEERVEETPERSSYIGPLPSRPRVLLVEDEPSVRQLIAEILESGGYDVMTAENGVAALALARAASQRIDLVLTDVVMPNMGGEELANTLKTEHPGLPIIFMSGYTRSDLLNERVAKRETDFLAKPVRAGVLLEKVASVLLRARETADEETG